MNRRCGASKENRRPAGSVCSFQQDERLSELVRRPLGERKPSNQVGVDVGPCLKWLEGAVAQSRAWKESQASAPSPRSPISASKMFNSSSSSSDGSLPLANAPPAQPSRSPDFIRKKSSRDMLDGCFGVGPTVKGDVKDRRKSKPRALLTVEPLPNVAALSHVRGMRGKGLPRPGRASLEWISDDPDTDSTTNTDMSGACDDGSSGDSSLCSDFNRQRVDDEWQHLRASRIHAKFNQEAESDISLSKSWETLLLREEAGKTLSDESSPEASSRKTDSSFSFSEVDTVVGTYESCHTRQAPPGTFSAYGGSSRSRVVAAEPEPNNDQHKERQVINKFAGRRGVCEIRPSHVMAANALRKLTIEHFEVGGGSGFSEVSSGFNLANGYDSLNEQVKSLQVELKSLLHSASWKE